MEKTPPAAALSRRKDSADGVKLRLPLGAPEGLPVNVHPAAHADIFERS